MIELVLQGDYCLRLVLLLDVAAATAHVLLVVVVMTLLLVVLILVMVLVVILFWRRMVQQAFRGAVLLDLRRGLQSATAMLVGLGGLLQDGGH